MSISTGNNLTFLALLVNLILSAFLSTACQRGAKLSTQTDHQVLGISVAATVVAATQFIFLFVKYGKAVPANKSVLLENQTLFLISSILLLVAFATAGLKVLEVHHHFLTALYCAIGVGINITLLTLSSQKRRVA